MGPALNAGRVFSPLDEELGLLAGTLAPRQQEHLVHLASWMPFDRAAQMLERLLQVQSSRETARRLTERAGVLLEAEETEQAQAPCSDEDAPPQQSSRLALSADGAMVPLVKGEWAEARTLAIGTVKASAGVQSMQTERVEQLSYFSRVTTAETFTALAELEMRRRQVVQAEEVCAVSDGAPWLQNFFDLHRADAVRILDFPHAAEHLSVLLQAIEQAGYPVPVGVLARCLHILKHRGPGWLLRLAARFPEALREQDGVREQLSYFTKREAMMQYPQFQKLGWPIGSAMVESANKLVVQARLKGAGQHWQPRNVNPMLALRNAVCNQRWSERWQVVRERTHQQQVACRRARARLRTRAVPASASLSPLPASPPPAPTPSPVPAVAARLPDEPAATLPGSSRPSAHHPWKRGPSCAKRQFAKI
jgi:hypothetical protein